jgi:hypothetical protein
MDYESSGFNSNNDQNSKDEDENFYTKHFKKKNVIIKFFKKKLNYNYFIILY